MEKNARQKLFARAFEEASGKDAITAGSALLNAANQQGVFDEEKDEVAKRLKNLGAKFGLKNLKQNNEKTAGSSVLEDVSVGNVNEDKNKKTNNPLDIDLSMDQVGLSKNFDIGNFQVGANINQPFEGDTEFGVTGSGEIIPGVNLNLNLSNKNQNAMMNFNKRF
tara:strand:- start:207 stop:701 length:495 start_codon:yes stop_codon:yes gene_type:complete